ncbi:hypothetical protein BHE74_00034889 [Ensete ventricosum]|nr:hypothetical protein BHE74_00034889 [Ensete ventricosum]
MRSLARSRGAVRVLAAAPAIAPAVKRAAPSGTSASSARGCRRSCSGDGNASLSLPSSLSFSLSLTPEATPPSPPLETDANTARGGGNLLGASPRPGMGRHTTTASFLLIVVGLVLALFGGKAKIQCWRLNLCATGEESGALCGPIALAKPKAGDDSGAEMRG